TARSAGTPCRRASAASAGSSSGRRPRCRRRRCRPSGTAPPGFWAFFASSRMPPFWNGSSAFTVLISVDLPDPDGPQTTTTSPFSILVVLSVSTWKVPYHLETSLMSIMGGLGSRSADDGDLLLQPADGHREAEADDEVDD